MTLFWQDGLEVITHLFANPVFTHCMETTPYAIYDCEGCIRAYGEFMSSQYAWDHHVCIYLSLEFRWMTDALNSLLSPKDILCLESLELQIRLLWWLAQETRRCIQSCYSWATSQPECNWRPQLMLSLLLLIYQSWNFLMSPHQFRLLWLHVSTIFASASSVQIWRQQSSMGCCYQIY